MVVNTAGIVLSNLPYGETSVISKIFTRDFGLVSYMVNGVRKSKPKISSAHLQPGNLLEMVVYHKNNDGLQRIKELQCSPVIHHIHQDMRKMSVMMFAMEMLSYCLQEGIEHEDTFNYVQVFIKSLELWEGSLGLWPSYFLVGLSDSIGLSPDFEGKQQNNLNMKEGSQIVLADDEVHQIAGEESTALWLKLSATGLSDIDEIATTRSGRNALLNDLIYFFKYHLIGEKRIKSIDVLTQVMHNS